MHEQSCRRGAHAYPRVVSNVFCTGANTVPVHLSPFYASCIASYTILRRRMALPPPLHVRSGLVQFVSVYVWSGSVRSCLVRSGLIWSGPVRSAPLRSVPLMFAPLVLWLSSDSVVPRRCAKAISPISLAQSIVYNKLSTI